MAETPKKGVTVGHFTENDIKLFTAMIQNLMGDIDTDWDVVASLCGYKAKTIAKTRWAQIRKEKITAPGSSDDLKIKTRTPKKKAAAEMDGADDIEDEEAADIETPKTDGKKKKGDRTPKAKKVKTEPVEEEGEEEVPVDEEEKS